MEADRASFKAETADGRLPLAAGRTLLLPAALPAVTCVPDGPLGVLVATLPEGELG